MHKGCPTKQSEEKHIFLIKKGLEDEWLVQTGCYVLYLHIHSTNVRERKRAKKVFKYFFKVIHAWLVSYNWVTIQSWWNSGGLGATAK